MNNLRFAVYRTEIGNFIYYYDEEGITRIDITKEDLLDEGKKCGLTDKANVQMREYLSGKRKIFELPLKIIGTEFQKKVWKALKEIPYGETRTYKDIAIAIGNEKACRAVGMANNKNPLIIVVPCHRVIGSNGSLVGYGKGLELKKFLLNLEQKADII